MTQKAPLNRARFFVLIVIVSALFVILAQPTNAGGGIVLHLPVEWNVSCHGVF